MKYVYVLGLPESGGCWLSNDNCYATAEGAKHALETKYAGLGLRVFTLYVRDQS